MTAGGTLHTRGQQNCCTWTKQRSTVLCHQQQIAFWWGKCEHSQILSSLKYKSTKRYETVLWQVCGYGRNSDVLFFFFLIAKNSDAILILILIICLPPTRYSNISNTCLNLKNRNFCKTLLILALEACNLEKFKQTMLFLHCFQSHSFTGYKCKFHTANSSTGHFTIWNLDVNTPCDFRKIAGLVHIVTNEF